jgi:uncharacterized membrane protein
MNLRRRYSFTRYARSALWVVPFIAIFLELILANLLHELDALLNWRLLGLGVPGAQAMLQAIINLTLSFIVFTFGSLLVAIQVANGQLTPRIIAATLLRNDVVKYTVGLFVFTLLFAVSAVDRTETRVHQLVLVVVAGLGLLSIAAFLYLIDYAARLLRPISILARVAEDGLAVVETMYPEPTQGLPTRNALRSKSGQPSGIISNAAKSQIVLAVDIQSLVAEAKRANVIIEFIPAVGDFVGKNEPLFALYGDGASVNSDTLRAAVSLGAERTLEQDPTFAFRIMIDIALKALSPAINDPTTAVLAIDQLHAFCA